MKRNGRWLLALVLLVGLPFVAIRGHGDASEASTSPVAGVPVLLEAKEFEAAIHILRAYLLTHPDDDEVRGQLARVLSWNQQYDEAVRLFQDILIRHPVDMEVRVALGRVLAWNGDYADAERELLSVLNERPEEREATEALADLYFWTHRHREALTLYETLAAERPSEVVNARIRSIKEGMTPSPRAPLDTHGELRLPYRRYIKTGYSHSVYSRGIPNERNWLAEAALPWGQHTVVARFEQIHRFGFQDSQASAEWYRPLWQRAWGYVSGSAAPQASVVPRWTVGGELFQGLAPLAPKLAMFEPSFGYRHLSYAAMSVNLLVPGLTLYLPYSFWLTEKLYYVAATGAATLSSQLTWRPWPRLQLFASGAFGTAGERIVAEQDLVRVHSRIYQAGVLFPVATHWAMELRGTYEDREGLYLRREGAVTVSYVW